jgi:hypothetical protein
MLSILHQDALACVDTFDVKAVPMGDVNGY